MKLTKTENTKIKAGMTLIEITVVILVLLTLISVLFIGASIYKRGADRAACILNIRNIHQAVRADQNLTNKTPDAANGMGGDTLTLIDVIYSTATVENYLVAPTCPTDGGIYTKTDRYPSTGTAAVTCLTNGDGVGLGDHFPADIQGW